MMIKLQSDDKKYTINIIDLNLGGEFFDEQKKRLTFAKRIRNLSGPLRWTKDRSGRF